MEIMKKKKFLALFKSFPVKPLVNDYYGPLGVLSPANPKIRRLITKLNSFVDKGVVRSKFFSPDLVFIGRKK